MMGLFVLTVLGLTGEQWNGPEGAGRCGNLGALWTKEFDVGERAFMLQSQSYICEGVDCDGDGGFFAKYAWKCAAKGSGGKASQDIQAPYVSYVITGSTAEFHSHKSCQFFEDIGDEGSWTTNVTGSCTVPKASECQYPDPHQCPPPAGYGCPRSATSNGMSDLAQASEKCTMHVSWCMSACW